MARRGAETWHASMNKKLLCIFGVFYVCFCSFSFFLTEMIRIEDGPLNGLVLSKGGGVATMGSAQFLEKSMGASAGEGSGIAMTEAASGPNGALRTSRHRQPQPLQPTLALLYPPGMIGGYRNQVLRFIGFVSHAQSGNITQLLLPTLVWTTQFEASGTFYPIAMEDVFDVEFWNEHAEHLPLLVPSIDGGDCWTANGAGAQLATEQDSMPPLISPSSFADSHGWFNATTAPPLLESVWANSPFLVPIQNISYEISTGQSSLKPRKLDLLDDVAHCKHPLVYGGGKGAGRLWNDYLRLSKDAVGKKTAKAKAAEKQAAELLRWTSRALRPSMRWRQNANGCVAHHLSDAEGLDLDVARPYLALHARVEVDMMVHRCGKDMEFNLTKILGMVDAFIAEEQSETGSPFGDQQPGIFLAVSRTGMHEETTNRKVKELARQNVEALMERSLSNLDDASTIDSIRHDHAFPVFECGEIWMKNWYEHEGIPENFFGSLVPSVMNFHLATTASIFIGVAHSSWSTHVWTNRYHQGRGSTNFEYTKDGIRRLENGGLPKPHENCK